MKLTSVAKKVEDGIEETLTYMDFHSQHWTKIRTNNNIKRLIKKLNAEPVQLVHSLIGKVL